MANYTNMVKNNRNNSDAMTNLALNTISEMVNDGEEVTTSQLVNLTGFSRSFFYSNPTVNQALRDAKTLQTGKVFPNKRKEALLKAKDAEITMLKRANNELKQEIEKLKKELATKSNSEFDFVSSL